MIDWNYWNPFKPWARSREEVVRILNEALSGKLDCREWDNFVSIPMKADAALEAIRAACEALQAEESIEEGFIAFTPKGRAELEKLIGTLVK